MSRQDANAAFALSSFLQGANATYIDELYARYENDPASVHPECQEVFNSLKDPPAAVGEGKQGTGDWSRAVMVMRAYRMGGHFHAKLDPLGLEPARDHEELDPRTYGFTEADFDRKIFLDHVLGLDYATLREIVAILDRTYCQTLGVEFMHISNGTQKAWIQERIEGPDKEISFTPECRRAILMKLIAAQGFQKFSDLKSTVTNPSALALPESLI